MIAPFWTDIDLRSTDGVVYLGHVSRHCAEDAVSAGASEVFEAARLLLVMYEGDTGFLPTEVVTVTWQNVSPHPGSRYSEQVRAQQNMNIVLAVNCVALVSQQSSLFLPFCTYTGRY